jgi:hypothetical protein
VLGLSVTPYYIVSFFHTLLLVSPELQSRCGERYCNEAELLLVPVFHFFLLSLSLVIIVV